MAGIPTRERKSAAERMDEIRAMGINCDPLQVLMEVASGTKLMPDGTVVAMKPPPGAKERVKAAEALASFLYPKRKAMELTGDNQKPIAFAVIADLDSPPEIPASHKGQLASSTAPRELSQRSAAIIIEADEISEKSSE